MSSGFRDLGRVRGEGFEGIGLGVSLFGPQRQGFEVSYR